MIVAGAEGITVLPRAKVRSHWVFWLSLMMIGAGAAGLRIFNGLRTIDDAFITFRYARNLAEGLGFVYNPGQHVLGTTTPLYTLVLALLLRFTGVPLPNIGLGIAAIADASTAILLGYLIVRGGARPIAGILGALVFAVATTSLLYAESGMETSLFTCLLILCCTLYAAKRDLAWGFVGGLASLTRPEGMLLLLILIGDSLWRTRGRLPWRALAGATVVCVPWIAWATWYFGQPLPQSMLAKGGAIYLVAPDLNARNLYQKAGSLLLGPTMVDGGATFLILASIATWWRLGRTTTRLRTVLLFVAIFVAGYALAGLHGIWMFDWYPVPLTPFYFFALFVGMDTALQSMHYRVAMLAMGIFGSVLLSTQLGVLDAQVLSPAAHDTSQREGAYIALCTQLNRHLTTHTVLAAPEIGAIGYTCHAHILDTVGLVTPGLARYYPVPLTLFERNGANYVVPPRLIDDLRPSYVVALDVFIRSSLMRDATFQHNYHIVERIPSTMFGSHFLLAYQRSAIGTPILPASRYSLLQGFRRLP